MDPVKSFAAKCELCSWRSSQLPEFTAQQIATIHVIAEHPESYEEVIGSPPPELSDYDRNYLLLFTDSTEVS